jgi:hypothetical protein
MYDMKVFISWSGTRSQSVAELLKDWLPSVLQATAPWISTRDLARGSIWFSELYEQLKETAVGIVCLTHENKDHPWLVFESGALAKGLQTARICTLLIDLKPQDVEGPLAHFNHTLPIREGMLGMLTSLNDVLGEAGLEPRRLDKAFETYWPDFEKRFDECLRETPSSTIPARPRSTEELLAEILENTRSTSSRLAALDRNGPSKDKLSTEIQRRQDFLMSLEAMKLLNNGMAELDVLQIVSGIVREPERVAWIMNRAIAKSPQRLLPSQNPNRRCRPGPDWKVIRSAGSAIR